METKIVTRSLMMESLSQSMGWWSGAKHLSPEDLGLDPADVANAFHLGKKMLVPEAVIHQFRSIEALARKVVADNSFSFPIGYARFVPRSVFEKVHQTLEDYKTQYMALADEMVANFEAYRNEMLPIYQEAARKAYAKKSPTQTEFSLATDTDPIAEREEYVHQFMERINSYYPPVESLRRQFYMRWDVYRVAIPDMEASVADEIAHDEHRRQDLINQYEVQTRQKVESFVDTVVQSLRAETVDFFDHVATMVATGKTVGTRTIESMINFIDRYKMMNFTHDSNIEGMLEGLKKDILDAYPASTFKDDEGVKMELHRRIIAITEAAQNLSDVSAVAGNYRRRIAWQEQIPDFKAA